MHHQHDRFRYAAARAAQFGQSKIISRYAGLPPSVELPDRYLVEVWDPGCRDNQFDLVDVPASPGETANGRGWAHTQSTASTVTIVDTGFPPFLRIATGAGSGQGQQMQAAVGATGTNRTMYSTLTAEELFFSITMRLSDANNNANTVEQINLFAGFAPVDTSIIAGVDDYIGFATADGSGLIKLVADQTSGFPLTGASSSVNVANITTQANGGRNLINKWFTLSFIATGLSRAAQSGTVYAFLDQHLTPAGASRFAPTHLATLDLGAFDDVPGADMAPTIAFTAGEAVAKNLDIAKIVCAAAYRLGV